MADCAACGRPTKAGDWNCGSCGAPLKKDGAGGGAAAPPDPYGYAPGYEPQPAAASAPAPSGTSGAVRLAVIIAVIAVLAIVAVWFFVLRGPSTNGDEFLGAWNATGTGVGAVTIARGDGDFRVTLTGAKAGETAAVPAHLDGSDLVITVDDFAEAAGDENADAFKAMLTAIAGDFRLIFSSVDPTHLRMTIEGSDAIEEGDNTTTLEKAVP
jgi:hypothetical protein